MLFPRAKAKALLDFLEKTSAGGVQFTVTAKEFNGRTVTMAIFAGTAKVRGSEGGVGTSGVMAGAFALAAIRPWSAIPAIPATCQRPPRNTTSDPGHAAESFENTSRFEALRC